MSLGAKRRSVRSYARPSAISALKDRPDLQLLVALCGFLGLRPSEASGLAWDCVDLTTGQLHIRRGVVRNVVGDLKTEGSSASLPLIEPVGSLLELVRKAGARTWVFENSAGKPADLKAVVWRFIKPAIEKWNSEHEKENQIRWLGLYGLRRSAASLLWSLTGDTQASQLLLRHSSPQTTIKHYLTVDRSKLARIQDA
ncbi:MAG: tyrosine-type recombinase/integrase [Terriglobales bacterium]